MIVPTTTALGIAVGTLMVVTVLVTLMTGSLLASMVVVALLVLLGVVLVQYGFVHIQVQDSNIDIFAQEPSAPAPAPAPNQPPPRELVGNEVYHVNNNQFTYEDAPAVCAAYGGELATQEQVEEAYNGGAEWCGYGWSAGGVALFPTQKGTWEQLQKEVDPVKRTACGRPGVNGGYFDPTLKFGVNCYGRKPKGSAVLPAPPPGTDNEAFMKQVNAFKNQLKDFILSPFNRTTWSVNPNYGAQFETSQMPEAAPTHGLAFKATQT